ncbi:MAG: hypothetical protein KCHDKBKB_01643 [Elusimicrobia bacterium]|nr:hypothetical protein [Elusimicrobiota bacterium]
MNYTVLIGRVCFSAIFIMANLGHFSKESIGYAASHLG